MNNTRFLMVQGTSSDAGKSTLVAALCRIFADEGYRVAPFKAQNMSSNSYITEEGEMAHAQALQAQAARIEPSVYMNPILLKPVGDYVSKVIILGKEQGRMHAKEYYERFIMKEGLTYVMKAIKHLAEIYDTVVIEGAGSPAEINLADYDLANMKLAEILKAPVIIVADIDRGGCFASMLGTLQLLSKRQRDLVKGFIINKFRGDKAILESAIDRFEDMTGKPILGIIPLLDLALPSEDSLSLRRRYGKGINIAVIRYPASINLSALDPLIYSSDSNVYYVKNISALDPDLILLPPSRDPESDLHWLHETGIAEMIKRMHKKGSMVVGLCEGYAMMGKNLRLSKDVKGLGLLDADFKVDEYTSNLIRRGIEASRLKVNSKAIVTALISRDKLALGSTTSNFLSMPEVREMILGSIAKRKGMKIKIYRSKINKLWNTQLDKLAAKVRDSIDLDRIKSIADLN